MKATEFSLVDSNFMSRALALAARGADAVHPNPMVGAVIVADGLIVGEGWHQCFGGPHAEVHAISAAKGRTKGATMYLTLEPCNHHGQTPPCTEAVLAAGIKRLVIASLDENSGVAGGGAELLRQRGILVEVGLQAEAEQQLNVRWRQLIKTESKADHNV